MGVAVREKVKGSGIWWVFINHKGKRKSLRVGEKRQTQGMAKMIHARLLIGELELEKKKDPNQTFKECAAGWLEYIKATRRESTYIRYRNVLRAWVYKQLGDRQISQIKRGEVRDLLMEHINNGLSKSMVRLLRDVLSGVFGHALDEELIAGNPVQGITKKLQLSRKREKPVDFLASEEVNLVLEACRQHYPEYYAFS